MIFPSTPINKEEGPFRNTAKYQEKTACTSIPDEQKLWRYMDYYKFESLIESRALYFSRIDNFSDKFEGKWARTNLDAKILVSDAERGPEEYNADRRIRHAAVNDILRLIYVNCFTIRDNESSQMWAEYTKNSESIAIQTTFSKLKNSFVEYPRDNKVFTEVYASKIRYLKDDRDYMSEGSVLFPILYKRPEFQHENELRLFSTYSQIDSVIGQIRIEDLRESGKESIAEYLSLGILPDFPALNISIHPGILIEKIVVHPKADEVFLDKVKELARKKGITAVPSRSMIEM